MSLSPCAPTDDAQPTESVTVTLDEGIDAAVATIRATHADLPIVLRASWSLQLTRTDADLIGASLVGRLDWYWTGVPNKHLRRTIRNGVLRQLALADEHQPEPAPRCVAEQMLWQYRRRTGARPPAGLTHSAWLASVTAWLAA